MEPRELKRTALDDSMQAFSVAADSLHPSYHQREYRRLEETPW